MRKLPRGFYLNDTVSVARALLGCVLWHRNRDELLAARIVETEAYLGANDMASHARRGIRTPRNESMYLEGGHAYVYLSYGMHWCMNVVTGPEGTASAVLLRAGEVVDGLELARSRRPGARDRELARGPARLTKALGVDGTLGGTDLLDPASPLRLLPGPPVDPARVCVGPRVGVAGPGAPTPWRFWVDGEPTVSPYRPAVPRRRPVR
jgi:DNA-3-methyladenine glycosylase